MRDLMAVTGAPEVISLAGGLPDTSTFPTQSFGRADDPGSSRESAARALQYGPTEGFEEPRIGILEVMGPRGCCPTARTDRHHRRPAGDRPRLQTLLDPATR